MLKTSTQESWSIPGDTMKHTFPAGDFITDDFDGDLILTFLTEFHLFEQALVRAGYTRASSAYRNAQPDWIQYARHIERRFRPDSSVELEGAVAYLLFEPSKRKLRDERLESPLPEEASNAESDILWLAELVQETGRKLSYGIQFLERSEMETSYLTAALLVLAAMSACDPTVDGLHMRVQ